MFGTIHVLDFEGNSEFGIVEFGVVTLVDMRVFDCIGAKCKSNSETVVSRNFRESSRTRDELGDDVEFHEHVSKFVELRRSGIFCAHSSQTEKSLLRSYLPTPGIVPSFYDGGSTSAWGPWLDTKLLYSKGSAEMSDYSLMALINAWKLLPDLNEVAKEYCMECECKHHNALYDALASALLLINFVKIANVTSLVDLIEFCA